MKKVVLFAVIVLTACASQPATNRPEVGIHLEQVNTPPDIFYFAGPLNLQYQISVTNLTDQPITLKRLELRTVGPGAYRLRSASTPMNVSIPPKGSKTVTISAWGYSNGGYLTATEPVTLNGIGYFDSPSGPFVRIFNENIFPGR
jgi:hypothetical protein